MVERSLVIGVVVVLIIAAFGIVGDDLFTAFNTFVCEMTKVTVCEVK